MLEVCVDDKDRALEYDKGKSALVSNIIIYWVVLSKC